MKIIKFTALWCADCIVMRPMWQELSRKYPNLTIEDYDFDQQSELAKNYQVKKVPNLIIVTEQGTELERLEGLRSKQELFSVIEKHLNIPHE